MHLDSLVDELKNNPPSQMIHWVWLLLGYFSLVY